MWLSRNRNRPGAVLWCRATIWAVGERGLKRYLLASVGCVALMAAGPADAADQAAPILKAPPAAVWSWSGFYIGGHGGYGWGHDNFSNLNDPIFNGKFPGFLITGFDSQ